ncbi:MAG: hypothetical protein A2283_01860 [Lentisphaerae bacterium RIFOXYA12_FULL_48_11]|nr:MAG: hypothetical protein A2283_01860 [Lentisphaerae bacterium RIFOXYA12_FULL_48_11]
MVFVGGSRQVGKTTLALSLLRDGSEKHPAYLNGDNPDVRRTLLGGALREDNKTTCITYFYARSFQPLFMRSKCMF